MTRHTRCSEMSLLSCQKSYSATTKCFSDVCSPATTFAMPEEQSLSNETEAIQSVSKNAIDSNIQTSKIMLEFMDNPRRLWDHLRTKIKNMFCEWLVIQKQAIRLTHTRPDLNLQRLIELLVDINENSEFIKFVCKRMSKFKIDNLGGQGLLERHLRQLFKELFHVWFVLQSDPQILTEVSSERQDGNGSASVNVVSEELRKGSKIINFGVETIQEGETQGKGRSEGRLEKIGGYESLF